MSLRDVLDGVTEGVDGTVKAELVDLLSRAGAQRRDFVRETAVRLERWLLLRADGELDDAQLRALLDARRESVHQHLDILDPQTRMRLHPLTLGVVDLVAERILGRFL